MSAPPTRNVVIGLIAGSWIVNTVARAPGNSAPAARTAASAAAEPSNAISRLAAMAPSCWWRDDTGHARPGGVAPRRAGQEPGCARCDVRRLGGDDRPDRGPVRDRPVRVAAGPCAHGRVPRGRDRVGVLRQRRARVRCRVRADRGLGLRRAVLRRLHRREEPVGRQPVRVRGDHVHVRGARRAPAARPDLRDPGRAGHAGDLHRARRRR